MSEENKINSLKELLTNTNNRLKSFNFFNPKDPLSLIKSRLLEIEESIKDLEVLISEYKKFSNLVKELENLKKDLLNLQEMYKEYCLTQEKLLSGEQKSTYSEESMAIKFRSKFIDKHLKRDF